MVITIMVAITMTMTYDHVVTSSRCFDNVQGFRRARHRNSMDIRACTNVSCEDISGVSYCGVALKQVFQVEDQHVFENEWFHE